MPLLAVVVGLLALVAQGGPAVALPVLDQVADPAAPGSPDASFVQFNERSLAQSFTVGITGELTRIDVFVSALDPEGNLLVSVVALAGGVPSFPAPGTRLALASVPLADVPSSSSGGSGPGWVAFDLPEPVPVVTGSELAFALVRDRGGTSTRFGVVWYGAATGYGGGEMFGQALGEERFGALDSSVPDRAFRTWVEPTAPIPEPTSVLLFLLAGAAVQRRCRLSARPGRRPSSS